MVLGSSVSATFHLILGKFIPVLFCLPFNLKFNGFFCFMYCTPLPPSIGHQDHSDVIYCSFYILHSI